MNEFETFYRGQWTEREKPCLEEYLAEARALEQRGPIDVDALIAGTLPEGTPGVGPKLVVDGPMMTYQAGKYDPENPLYFDDDYARRAGYQGRLAYPSFADHDDTFLTAFPHAARDMMLVCSLNHSMQQLAPVYEGDTLYLVKDAIHLTDITPDTGSEFRSLVIRCEGSIYNQHGQTVLKVMFGATENLKSWLPGKVDPSVKPWISPDWWKRPQHVYTAQDWDTIKAYWRSETRRGSDPLYWEDVKIGDMPVPTLEGPIESTANPTPPYGMGIGGSRTMKKELLDPSMADAFTLDEKTGIYFPKDETVLTPTPAPYVDPRKPMGPPPGDAPADGAGGPGGPAPKAEPKRGIFINFAGRDFAIRHINNYMGDHGWLKEIGWGIMTNLSDYGYADLPMNPEAPNYVDLAPCMKGRHLNAHGLQHDVMIIRSQVYDKLVKDGEYLVKLAFWMETLDGYVYEHGAATIRLPHREK